MFYIIFTIIKKDRKGKQTPKRVCVWDGGRVIVGLGAFPSSKGPNALGSRVQRLGRELKPYWLRYAVGGALGVGYLKLCSIVAERVFQLVWHRRRTASTV